MSLESDKLIYADEWMKLIQDDYKALPSKHAANIYRSGEGQLVAGNKTTEGPSTSDFRKGHKKDI